MSFPNYKHRLYDHTREASEKTQKEMRQGKFYPEQLT